MPIDWKSPEAYQRLLAAIVAAQDGMKLDYRRIASMYGQGATYDSIEGRFRIIKKEAAILRSEIDTGVRTAAPPRGSSTSTTSFSSTKSNSQNSTPKKPKTPSKKKEGGVMTGRISKNGTPSKKTKVKEEVDLTGDENGDTVKEDGNEGEQIMYAHIMSDNDADADGDENWGLMAEGMGGLTETWEA